MLHIQRAHLEKNVTRLGGGLFFRRVIRLQRGLTWN